MKDPAVLFYTQDFITGTLLMTDEQRGKYIMLLCLQHQNGKLTERDMLKICKEKDEDIWCKFYQEDGFYYNKRMLLETQKRNNYTESRRKNLQKSTHMDSHMEPHMENENENENINRDEERKKVFDNFRKQYPGTKRGNEVEFANFVKKHKDWKDILPILSEKLAYQIEARKIKAGAGGFVPEWKNLQTWINQRCWEEEIGKVEKKIELPKTYDEMVELHKKDPNVFSKYTPVKKPGERQATFYPINQTI
jgi:hypothetical protein